MIKLKENINLKNYQSKFNKKQVKRPKITRVILKFYKKILIENR
jgi:hypothetical protein